VAPDAQSAPGGGSTSGDAAGPGASFASDAGVAPAAVALDPALRAAVTGTVDAATQALTSTVAPLPGAGGPAATPAAATLSAGAHAALPSHIAELARSARIAADGSARLTVRLDPPELGAVTLHLRSRGGEVELAIRAETPGGASALAAQQSRVRELLASHGFDLSRFSVASSDPAGSSADADARGAGNDSRTGGESGQRREQDGRGFADLVDGGRGENRRSRQAASPWADAEPAERAAVPSSPRTHGGTWL
jgi:flagellar hook-length control protein FliK